MTKPSPTLLSLFRDALSLDDVLRVLGRRFAGYQLLAHWTQGEFHHDVVFELPDSRPTPSAHGVLVVSTNCNGGVKELLLFGTMPERRALWNSRCPDNSEFSGEAPPLLARLRTVHWFDPCELLRDDARSELRPEFRRRQLGGGWMPNERANYLQARGQRGDRQAFEHVLAKVQDGQPDNED